MPSNTMLVLVFLCIGAALLRYTRSRNRTAHSRLPPGPVSDFLIGHARKIPLKNAWKVYSEWNKTFGDVVYAHALGRSLLIINSVRAARDLLEKKSLSFSDRPSVPVISLMGWGLTLPILPYGPRFRKHRRMMHQYFGPQTVALFRPMQEHETRKFLRSLLQNQGDFVNHIHRLVAGVIALITYGHEVTSEKDAYVEMVDRAMYMTASSGTMGATIIDFFPFLRHLPAWLPGMGLKRLALQTRELVNQVTIVPYEEVKRNKASGSQASCIISDLLQEYDNTKAVDSEHEKDIMNIGTAIFNAGTDTTKSVLMTFFIMMAYHADVVRRAQDEIDNVVGAERLPTFDDRESLPYIDCIIKELLRVYPPLPLGVPHRSTAEEHYREWTIPEGTMAMTNIWGMMRDERNFPGSEGFRPERHMRILERTRSGLLHSELQDDASTSVSEDDPSSIVFGFGRRVCPGKHFADSMLWMTIANVLAAFHISPYHNPETGHDEMPTVEFENEIILTPKPFKCTIIPRSAKHVQLITRDAEV